uniref:TEPSIN adaptor related protein complex 4 accessory protein n=1 Tax=Cynoglossus semilaevis TaxID=244447 RepID=A0A3P8UIZ8_CYNSE
MLLSGFLLFVYLCFLHLKVPTLMKATADDETPCPGYLFQEIGKISHESLGCGQCLLEYLLERLQVESCFVKLKVLKIFVHLCSHGSHYFLIELRRNSTFIQQASGQAGPPDPIHGTALYQRVRNSAQVRHMLCRRVVLSCVRKAVTPWILKRHHFHVDLPASTDSLLDKIQKAAEVVASAVLPPTEHQGIRLHDNHYRAVAAPPAPIEVAVRCPGQVGGGWEETDSYNNSSHNSSQDITTDSRASLGSKSADIRSASGGSRESSGDLSERVEALQLGDCVQEMALISRLTEGSRVFLSREENQHFIKECSTLNCEVVVELLSNKLQDPSNSVKMRALCAISCLMTSDLLSLEQMFAAIQKRLGQLREGTPGPVANKATKVRGGKRRTGSLVQCSRVLWSLDCSAFIKNGATKGENDLDIFVYYSRQSSTNQSPLSTSDSSVPIHFAHETYFNNCQSDVSPVDGTKIPNHKSPSSGLILNDQAGDLVNVSDEVKLSAARTADVKAAEDPELNRDYGSRPSLFSGMELVVTKGRLDREVTQNITGTTDHDLKQESAVLDSDGPEHSTTFSPSENPASSSGSENIQPVSAFSFLTC